MQLLIVIWIAAIGFSVIAESIWPVVALAVFLFVTSFIFD